jgi:hypothetical protein
MTWKFQEPSWERLLFRVCHDDAAGAEAKRLCRQSGPYTFLLRAKGETDNITWERGKERAIIRLWILASERCRSRILSMPNLRPISDILKQTPGLAWVQDATILVTFPL